MLTQGVRDGIIRYFSRDLKLDPTLLSLPKSAKKALALSLSVESSIRDFTAVLEQDEALASKVIKVANSVYYARGSASRTLKECIAVIGLTELREIIQLASLNAFLVTRRYASPLRELLWEHDIAVARVARTLSVFLNRGSPEQIFLGGLVHDIGKLLWLEKRSEDYQQILNTVRFKGVPFEAAEIKHFPFSHCDVGVLIGQEWSFPEEVLEIIAYHHEPWDEVTKDKLEVAIIKLADGIVHHLGLFHTAGFTNFRILKQRDVMAGFTALGINENRRQALIESVSVVATEGNPC